ncbi:MAG: prohibitin family protein [Mesorhizobium sp.]|nr:MAG: prohibitin family protein [Mesorhizobium sp.]
MKSLIALGVLAAAALSIGFSSFYTIDQGQRGILLTNGAYTATSEPGLHFKTPFFQSVVKITTRQNALTWEGESALPSYSSDQQTANLAVSVIYHIPDGQVENVYQNYGSVDGLVSRTIEQTVPQSVKTVFGKYTAVLAIQKRAELNREVADAVVKGTIGPIVVDSVQIKNIDFSDAYEATIEARMTAEVEVQKQKQVYEQEKVKAEIALAQAKGRADSVKAEADAKAYATKIQGDAEADAIKARSAALSNNPLIIDLTKAERWNGTLPTTVLPNGTVPFMEANK